MNIAFVTPQMIIGGAEQYVIVKTDWLKQHGHNSIVISKGGENVFNLNVRHYVIEDIDIPIYHLNKKSRNDLYLKLTQILRDEKIDIIEAHNTWPIVHVYNSYEKHRIPFILNVLSELSYNRNIILQRLTCYLAKNRLYFTLTENMNKYIEEKCKNKLNANIIPIPIEKQEIPTCDEPYVLSVCRMSKEKMYVKYLIMGFGDAVIKHKISGKYRLLIVGDGPLKDEVSKIVCETNRKIGRNLIEMRGTVIGDKLYKLYSGCRCYVGMGTTLLTAASYSKPCIRVGFQEDTMKYAWGYWSETSESKDEIVYTKGSVGKPISFSAILEQIVNDDDLNHEIGRNSALLVNSIYGIDEIMRHWVDSYESVIKAGDRSQCPVSVSLLQKALCGFYQIYRIFRKL